jgi:hypothetical protein
MRISLLAALGVPATRWRTLRGNSATVWAVAAVFAMSVSARADTLVPNQMHKSLTFELHSIKDDVQMYEGDPQYLLQFETRPYLSVPPKIEFSVANQVATLRVRDLGLFETPPDPAEEEEDPDLRSDKPSRPPVSQGWIIQLAPAGETEFVIQCDGGKGMFDFTDLPVKTLHMLADTTEVRIDWKRPNPVPLERLKITARSAEIEIHDLLNAGRGIVTLQLDDSESEVDLTGKPYKGEGEIFFEGVPKRLRLKITPEVALHLEGPMEILGRFERPNMVRNELALESADYAKKPSRLRLHFSQAVPKLEVHWEEH